MNGVANAFTPELSDFAAAYAEGGGVVWTRRVSDLETPVSALLKLGPEKPGVFLLGERARAATFAAATRSLA
jgi:hypothetical protein